MSCTKHDDDMQPDCVGCCPQLSGPTGQDRSAQSETLADELLYAVLMRDLFAALGWDRNGHSFNEAIAHIKSLVAGASQDVAALRAELGDCEAFSDVLYRQVCDLAKERDALRAELEGCRAMLLDYSAAQQRLQSERRALREQLATARERIAALEALADRWGESTFSLKLGCARELRAALTGGKP